MTTGTRQAWQRRQGFYRYLNVAALPCSLIPTPPDDEQSPGIFHLQEDAASFNTSNLRNTDRGETILRIISDRPPMENAVKVQPNLEDLYLFYFKGDTEE